MFGNHEYVPSVNSETAGSDDLTVNPVPFPLEEKMEGSRACAPSKFGSNPGSKILTAWSTSCECPSFFREAFRYPANLGHVSNSLPAFPLPPGLSEGRSGSRQLFYHIWAWLRCGWNTQPTLGKTWNRGHFRGHGKTTWPQENPRFPNACYRSPK